MRSRRFLRMVGYGASLALVVALAVPGVPSQIGGTRAAFAQGTGQPGPGQPGSGQPGSSDQGAGQTPNVSPGTSNETTSGPSPSDAQNQQGTGSGTGQPGTGGGTGTGGGPGAGAGTNTGTGSGTQQGSGMGAGQQGAARQPGGQAAGGPMQAGGSCGPSAGQYGATDVNASQVNQAGETVPALFYRVQYSGLPAPTTVGVIVRYNDELESQIGVQTFTAQTGAGNLEGALRANISPEAQGFANSINQARRGALDGPPDANRSTRPQNSPTQGGLLPGEYVFYVYTGEIVDTPEGRRFRADEKAFLGRFSCGVSTEQGSGPG